MNPNYMSNIVGAVTFATIGIVIFVVFFLILDWVTPYDLWKQLCEEKNQALATVVGAAIGGHLHHHCCRHPLKRSDLGPLLFHLNSADRRLRAHL